MSSDPPVEGRGARLSVLLVGPGAVPDRLDEASAVAVRSLSDRSTSEPVDGDCLCLSLDGDGALPPLATLRAAVGVDGTGLDGADADLDGAVTPSLDGVTTLDPESESIPIVFLSADPAAAVAADPSAFATAFAAGVCDVLDSDDPALVDRLRHLSTVDPAAHGTTSGATVDPAAPVETPTDSRPADAVSTPFGDAVCVVDGRFGLRRVTDSAATLLGLDDERVASRPLWASLPTLVGGSLYHACWDAILDGATTTARSVPVGDRFLSADVAPFDGGVAIRLRDVTGWEQARRSRDRYERILETIDDGVYILDENFRIVQVNEAVTRLTGYSREELVGAHSSLLASEEVLLEAAEVVLEILSGERSAGRLDVELETSDGDSIPVETRFSALAFPDGSHGSVGVVRDIRDRKRFERTLTALSRSTRELFQSETDPEVARLVVDTATEVLDLHTVSVHLFFDEETTLMPIAWAGGVTPPSITPGDGVLWRAFAEDDPHELTVSWGSQSSAGLAVPLGEHGLLVTARPEGTDAGEHRTLTELLAANAAAALDRVDRSMELAQRERALATRNEDLTRLNRFNELIRDVNRALVEADSREAIERAVCDRLAASPQVAFAWVGEYDPVADLVTPRSHAGAERGYLDESVTGDEPTVRAARTESPVLVERVATDLQDHPWRRRALDRDFGGVVSVPLQYHDFRYGVLSVYSTEAGGLDEATLTTLTELGETTANAISNAQAKESLQSESTVEVDLFVPAPNAPLLRMARAVDGRVELVGSVPSGDGTLLYLSVAAPPSSVDALDRVVAVERTAVVSTRDDHTLVEVLVDGPTVPARLADHGGAVRSLVTTDGAIEATVELPVGTDVREFVESVDDPYPGTELTAKRRRSGSVGTGNAFLSRVQADLTDRQFEVLRTAFFSGYFAWPRERTGEEVADSLGVSQPTLSRHLRVGLRKLLAALFEN